MITMAAGQAVKVGAQAVRHAGFWEGQAVFYILVGAGLAAALPWGNFVEEPPALSCFTRCLIEAGASNGGGGAAFACGTPGTRPPQDWSLIH